MKKQKAYTVLIVDDDRTNRMALASVLQPECQVILAKDGASALERAREEKNIHLILLDVSMPGMDGYEVLRRLRADPRTAQIAVIFITGRRDEADEERGLSLGAVDYVGKPIRPAIVRARIHNHLKLISQRKELQKMADRIQLAVTAGRVGVWDVEFADGRFIWDEQMYTLYGRTPGQFGGSSAEWMSFVHPEDEPGVRQKWEQALAGTSVFEHEFRVRLPSGDGRHLRAQARIFRDPEGRPVSAVGTNWDVTEHHQLNEALRCEKERLALARDVAEAAREAKSRFLATMSHEIRTPMNGVLGMARLLEGTPLTSEQQEMTSVIRRSGENLLVIINDILDFSKIEAGKLRIDPAPLNLREVVEETVALLAPQAEQKGVELVCDIDPGLSVAVLGDAGRIQQIVTNLTGNAVKFTREGEVCVTVHHLGETAKGLVFRVAVRDTGIGIPAEARARLFEPFSQADGGITRQFGGTGLGLAICRQLVELMGGKIEVTSREGECSVFSFELALPRVELPSTVAAAALPASIRALVVDDNASSRQVIAAQLKALGAEVETVSRGDEALAALRHHAGTNQSYQVVLIDRRMPDIDGLVLARAIRAEEALRTVPLILLDARLTNRASDEVALAGFQAILAKPVREAHLRRSVLRALGEAGFEATVTTVAPAKAVRRLRLLVAEDNELNQLVVRRMLEQLGHEVEIVDSGRKLLERIEHERFDAILMDCHMPEVDGYEATRRIRRGLVAGQASAKLPVIALTASAMPEDRERCLAAGMDAYVSKPLNPEALEAAFLRCGLLAEPAASTQEKAPPAANGETENGTLDLAHVNRLRSLGNGQDKSLWAEVEKTFLNEIPRTLADLEKLGRERKRPELLMLAHETAGSCAIIGARSLQADVQALAAAVRIRAWDKVPDCFTRIHHAWTELQQRLNREGAHPSG